MLKNALVIVALVLTTAAKAQESASDFLEPVVDRARYEAFCSRIDLADDQHVIAEMLYDDYRQSLDAAVDDANTRADAVGRQTVLAAISGRARVNTEELRRLRVAVLGEYRVCIEEVYGQWEALLDSTRQLLIDEQVPRIESAERWLRREVLLQPRSRRGGSTDYAGDGVDVLRLAGAAADAELAGIPQDELGDVLAGYEIDLDLVLAEIAAADLLARVDQRIDRLSNDADGVAATQRAGLARWRRLDDLNRGAARRIADLAASHGGAVAQQRWLERFDEAAFPWLFNEETPDRQHAWLASRRLDEQRREAVEKAYADYRSKRMTLARKAIDLILRARYEHGVIIHPLIDVRDLPDRGPRDIYQKLLQNSGERQRLVSTTTGLIEAALTAEDRSAMRATIRGRR